MDTSKITIDDLGMAHLKRYHLPVALPAGKRRNTLVAKLAELENVNVVHVHNNETLDIFVKDRDTWSDTKEEVNEILKKF